MPNRRLTLAVIGFVRLDDPAFATRGDRAFIPHGLPDPVRHEPSRFAGKFQGGGKLWTIRSDAAYRFLEHPLPPYSIECVDLTISGLQIDRDRWDSVVLAGLGHPSVPHVFLGR